MTGEELNPTCSELIDRLAQAQFRRHQCRSILENHLPSAERPGVAKPRWLRTEEFAADYAEDVESLTAFLEALSAQPPRTIAEVFADLARGACSDAERLASAADHEAGSLNAADDRLDGRRDRLAESARRLRAAARVLRSALPPGGMPPRPRGGD